MDIKKIDDRFPELHSGEIYYPSDEGLMKKQARCIDLCRIYNLIPRTPLGVKIRTRFMKKMFAEMGEDCYIEPPFYANFGGKHVHLGKGVYANFHLTCVDDSHIYIGDGTMIGPNCTIATAQHPIAPALRKKSFQYNKPVHIGKNCWLGSGVIVLPGVTIGDNTVVGAGAVVAKDLPSNVIAVGVPAKVLREINAGDDLFYDHGKEVPQNLFD